MGESEYVTWGHTRSESPSAAFCFCIPAVPAGQAAPAVFFPGKKMPPLQPPEDSEEGPMTRQENRGKGSWNGALGGLWWSEDTDLRKGMGRPLAGLREVRRGPLLIADVRVKTLENELEYDLIQTGACPHHHTTVCCQRRKKTPQWTPFPVSTFSHFHQPWKARPKTNRGKKFVFQG